MTPSRLSPKTEKSIPVNLSAPHTKFIPPRMNESSSLEELTPSRMTVLSIEDILAHIDSLAEKTLSLSLKIELQGNAHIASRLSEKTQHLLEQKKTIPQRVKIEGIEIPFTLPIEKLQSICINLLKEEVLNILLELPEEDLDALVKEVSLDREIEELLELALTSKTLLSQDYEPERLLLSQEYENLLCSLAQKGYIATVIKQLKAIPDQLVKRCIALEIIKDLHIKSQNSYATKIVKSLSIGSITEQDYNILSALSNTKSKQFDTAILFANAITHTDARNMILKTLFCRIQEEISVHEAMTLSEKIKDIHSRLQTVVSLLPTLDAEIESRKDPMLFHDIAIECFKQNFTQAIYLASQIKRHSIKEKAYSEIVKQLTLENKIDLAESLFKKYVQSSEEKTSCIAKTIDALLQFNRIEIAIPFYSRFSSLVGFPEESYQKLNQAAGMELPRLGTADSTEKTETPSSSA